jgi:ABC-type polysaccharide/polyol phosphate export permease
MNLISVNGLTKRYPLVTRSGAKEAFLALDDVSFLVSTRWRWLFGLNPMTGIVLAFRYVLLGTPFDLGLGAASACAAIVAAIAGIAAFLRLQDLLAEHV